MYVDGDCSMCMAGEVGGFSLLLGYNKLLLYNGHENPGVAGDARSGG